ncbi:MAG: protein translocase subunit SecF [Candidatus Paceibacteria bacterium]
MFVIQFRKLFVSVSLVLILGSALALGAFGLKPSIDFTGGTLIEVAGGEAARAGIEQAITGASQSSASVRPTGDGYIVRTPELSPEQVSAIEAALAGLGQGVEVRRISTIGPTLGAELFRKALVAIALVALAIIIFIGIAFWRVSKPLHSWVYGLVTLVTLMHDVLIPVGVFALLGYFANVEVGALFVVAMLTVLGYSVNDTIVVFDRVRENLRLNKEAEKHEDFERTVGRSLTQTYTRSINTSLTTIIVLLALFFFGGSQTEDFALALLVGVAAGAYSSIFFASPLLVMIERMSARAQRTDGGKKKSA